jgi:hypothetical protein
MEWALHISGAKDLAVRPSLENLSRFSRSEMLAPVIEMTALLSREFFGDIHITQCVFGNEFCEHLTPSAQSLDEAINAAREHELEFTLLTPFVGNDGINGLRPLFERLAVEREAEVVFNDWGVLNLLRREFQTLKPIQGRLLNKSLRDPRVTTMYASSPSPPGTLATLRQSNLECDSYAPLLRRFGVETVELDNLPQGIDLGFVQHGLQAHVYLPFGFISASRVCMAAGLHHAKAEKFTPSAPCRHECQTHLLEYAYTNSPFGNRDQKFYLKGNTYFYVHTEPMLRALMEQAQSGEIARLILQPRLPMTTI